MNNELETYKFSLKTLGNIIESIDKCNNNLDSNIKVENNNILSEIKALYNKLEDNINNYNYVEKEDDKMDLDYVTKILRDTIKEESNKVDAFSKYLDNNNCNYVLEDKFKHLFTFINNSLSQLNDIKINDSSDMIYTVICDKIEEEKNELKSIKDELNELLKTDSKYIFNSDLFNNFKKFINSKIYISKDILYNLRLFKENNKNVLNDCSSNIIGILNTIVEKQLDKLNNLYINLEEIIKLDKDTYEDINEQLKDKNDYVNKVTVTIEELYSKNASSEEIVDSLIYLYNDEHKNTFNNNIEYKEEEIDQKQKELDTKQYKNNFSKLNKSFWEARSLASEEGIKYPSSLYEKKVKEYQNNYLIDNYNISLEALEREIEDYKTKYASLLYMDKVYEDAIYKLKEETLSTIDEMCDESNGVSMLDLKVLEILNDDLMNVIREMGKVKEEENLNSFIDLEEYKKSIKLNNLIERKEMIEHQINIIKYKIINS